MNLEEKITDDLRAAMKAQDAMRTSCLRMLKTALKNRQVEKREKLKDEEVREIISSLIKKGKQAAEEFKKGGRDNLAAKEEAEIAIYFGYLPEQASPEEIEEILRDIIAEMGAEGPGDLGKVMKQAMVRLAGKAQGKEVNGIARRLLA